MPLLETKGAASAQGFGGAGAGASGLVTYIEDVFSTWLYTGNSSTQTITNGIDLSGKGGLVWTKRRSGTAVSHALLDTVRGGSSVLTSDDTSAAFTAAYITAFGNTGYTFDGAFGRMGANAQNYVSWTFRKQPKFFDIVTWTGNGGTSGRTITHNLGSAPGCIIVKNITSAEDWYVFHRSLGNTGTNQYFCILNSTAAQDTGGYGMEKASNWTATQFALSSGTSALNVNGVTYVAYLFAHNAGGFGLSGTDNVISCGSFTTDGSSTATINLGWEPQWVLVKTSNVTGNWTLVDTMRGWVNNGGSLTSESGQVLRANTSGAELGPGSGSAQVGRPFQTGFTWVGNPSDEHIYIAIRRGPMKVPTSGTSVYYAQPLQDVNNQITTGFPVDMVIDRWAYWNVSQVAQTGSSYVYDRLRGSPQNLQTNNSLAETASQPSFFVTTTGFQSNTQLGVGPADGTLNNWYAFFWCFRRAPGFFDVVCYTGDNQNPTRSIPHNLAAVPELIIHKYRNVSGVNWNVYLQSLGTNAGLILNGSNATITPRNLFGTPSASNFVVKQTSGDTSGMNWTGTTYVAYLFATCAGVSKVGSYTGTGALQTIDCGFTGGARFVLIKRTDSTGDWYVYDSARGISSGNDPYLLLNSTAAEVTGTNYVDTTSVGFQVTAAAPAGLNANGGSFVFLAIA